MTNTKQRHTKIWADANKEVGVLGTTIKFNFLCIFGVQSMQTFLVKGLVFGLEGNNICIWQLRQFWRGKHVCPAVVCKDPHLRKLTEPAVAKKRITSLRQLTWERSECTWAFDWLIKIEERFNEHGTRCSLTLFGKIFQVLHGTVHVHLFVL